MKNITNEPKNVKSKRDCQEFDANVEKLLWGKKLAAAKKLAFSNLKTDASPRNMYTLAITLAMFGFLKNNNASKKLAKKYYRKIIKKFPFTMHYYLAKARICEEGGELKKSIPFYKKAFQKCETERNAVHIGNVYNQLNKKKLAKRYYLIAENLKKKSAHRSKLK